MRLFYLVIFVVLSIGLANNLTESSSHELRPIVKEYLIKHKIFSKLNSSSTENETLQKDFINHPQFENIIAFTAIFFLLTFVVFVKVLRVFIKHLKSNYSCRFKILFPKHAFW
ncbi:hypothetical protein SAMN04488023_10817 [Pedobacter rhizosphaerae]|uniref:Uncharacterized protein n=1 Tax=Pedobacter rhizosphaerae TaxID=390241 RepID=A0A1H9NM75_9SPHI|nr:hypothetical protein SAMN04488023_10817 [Pedobacter rhizosphaerae]